MNPNLQSLLAKHNLTAPVRREITVEPKVLDAKKGIMRFTASDETLDCYNEIVRANGWMFTYFERNGPFVNSHNYSDIRNILGQVVAWEVIGGELVEDVQFALTDGGQTLADWAFAMYRDKFLRACSVGFVPVTMASKWDSDKTSILGQIAELKLDPATAAKLAAVYIKHEQIELSGCVIGANPNALAKTLRTVAAAYKSGCLSEESVTNFAALVAAAKPVNPADESAHAGATSTARTRLAVLAAIQAQL